MEIRPVNRADLPAIRDLFLRSVQEVAIRDYAGQCAAWTAGADKPGWAERFLVTWTIGAFCEDQLQALRIWKVRLSWIVSTSTPIFSVRASAPLC